MFNSLWWFVLVVGLTQGFTPSASVGGSASGLNGNMVDRTWDPVEHADVASYYPGPRPWSPSAGPHVPNNFGISLPPVSAPSCWSTPSIAGAAIISILAVGAIIAAKLPLILLAPAALTLLALPLALPLLAPVLALAFMMPMPMEETPPTSPGSMGMMAKPPDDPKKPNAGDNTPAPTASARLWSALNGDSEQCLQKIACQLGRHAGDTGLWMVKKLPESEWSQFREAYLEGSRSANQSDGVCGKFQCNAKEAFAAMSAAASIPGT